MRGLRGKTAIITGGGGGIGRAICLRLAQEGAVIGVFDKNADAARETSVEIARLGERAVPSEVDITDYEAVTAAVAEFEREVGPTAILVNNAGWDKFAFFLNTKPLLWD